MALSLRTRARTAQVEKRAAGPGGANSPLRVGAPPSVVFFGGDWDVHWGYDLGFDPWPYGVPKRGSPSGGDAQGPLRLSKEP